MANKVEIVNKKAKFEYTILDRYEAGIGTHWYRNKKYQTK